jgi:serine phosphatase RsbU (regulator of sigma subunit)/CheY-like chemotaxis protein
MATSQEATSMVDAGRVLVVDDLETHRYLMGTWLRRAGFEVAEAATGAEALSQMHPTLDAVVLDVNLPDMTGFDVCTAIKTSPRTSSIPVLHVSATAIDPVSRARGLNGGADGYLIEPLVPEEFLAVVRALTRIRATRRRTERLIAKLTQLAAVSLPLNAADSVSQLLEAAATGASEMFGSAAIASAAHPDGRASRTLCTAPDGEVITEANGVALDPAAHDRPVYLSADHVPAPWPPLLQRAGIATQRWCAVPMREKNAVVGGLAVALPEGGAELPAEEIALLERLAGAMSVSLYNVRAYTEEHRIALTLQRSLLPQALPVLPGLSFEARYFASGERVSVGGDFYDAFVVPGGDAVAAMGDVQGHSLQAATVMAELRFSLRAYLGEQHSLSTTLGLLDELMLRNHPEQTASVVLVRIDADRTRIRFANAGHVPPLLVTAAGVDYVEYPTGTLLGVGAAPPEESEAALVGPTSIVLVTDGLIERRTMDIEESLAAMRDVVREAATLAPAELADALLDRFASGQLDDDVAVLVIAVDAC